MDGTLYDLNDVVSSNYEMQVEFLEIKTGKDRASIVSFLEENHIYPVMKNDSKSATELFSRLGYDMQEWTDFREEHFDISAIDISKAVGNDCIEELATEYQLFLLSSNSYKNIKSVLSHIGISASNFSSIVCSDTFAKESQFDKRTAIQNISETSGIPYSNMISIGDRYMTDIKPMLELGGRGILLFSPDSMKRVKEDLISERLENCHDYDYYKSLS